MNKRNKNNSIVFLTTLSVYLGLVLVGGTPSILTYAALTRNFDIQNEIEVKDDLDNKPDNEEIESFSKDDFSALFAQFLNEVKDELNSRKIVFPIQTDFYLEGNFEKSEFLNQEISSSAVLSEIVLTKQIYENPTAPSENDQVFIVTRLPRGSLDALLAKDTQ